MKRILTIVAMLLTLGFILLSKYEDRAGLRALDFSVTVKVQERIDRSSHLRMASLVANVMEGATFFASPEFTVFVTLILTGYMMYAVPVNSRNQGNPDSGNRKRINWRALVIPLALTVIVLVEIYGKSIVHHPSPPFGMIKHPTTIFPADYVNEQFSYPSGHAARAAFLGLLLYSVFIIHDSLFKRFMWKILVTAGIVGYVFLVSVSRIYLGHHWFSDVLGGLLLGSALGVLTLTIQSKYNTPTMSD